MLSKNTICQNLEFLYRNAAADKRTGELFIIKECYVQAKKMNKKLLEYKYNGTIPAKENTSQSKWLADLESSRDRDSAVGLTKYLFIKKS